MKRIFLVLMCIQYNCQAVLGQTYDSSVMEAMKLYEEGQYLKSIEFWEVAFNKQDGFASDYYNAACTFSLAGKREKAFNYLGRAVKNGWSDLEWMKNDKDLESLHKSDDWEIFIDKIPELQTAYINSLNMDMKEELEELRIADQTIRELLPAAEERYGRESKNYQWFRHKLMPQNDSLVLNKVINIIENRGWLGISEVGELANQTLWLVIQHAPLEIQERYLPLLKKSVNNGESKAKYLAFLEDRILMRKDKEQVYGTQSLWNREEEKNLIWPIEDPENVNKRRKNVGLESIESYMKNNDFHYVKK